MSWGSLGIGRGYPRVGKPRMLLTGNTWQAPRSAQRLLSSDRHVTSSHSRGGLARTASSCAERGPVVAYTRFLAMVATSTVVMFGLMYTTVYTLDHVWFSQTKFWMALYMGGTMAIIMLSFMLGMY